MQCNYISDETANYKSISNSISITTGTSYDSYYDEITRLKKEKDDIVKHLTQEIGKLKRHYYALTSPEKIIKNNRTTVVIWSDKTKTIVRCEEGKEYDVYEAFTAALAKKLFQNNSRLKRMIKEKFVSQDNKKTESLDEIISVGLRFTDSLEKIKDVEESLKNSLNKEKK